MSDDPRIAEIAGTWWHLATGNLSAARVIQTFPSACALHAGLAVEQGIDTLLVLHQVDFERVHDVGELLALLRGSPTVLSADLISGLAELTRFTVDTGDLPVTVTVQEAADALARAERFLAWVEGVLPPEVRSAEGQA